MINLLSRCDWVSHDPLYIHYHDHEWGRVNQNSQSLFELLCLEGQQAGLSWLTILKKRQGYRECFYQFDPYKIVGISNNEVNMLMQDNRIIKNKLKLLSIINNAKAYLDLEKTGSFFDFLWQLVNYQPIINHWQTTTQIPSQTDLSIKLATQLRQANFKFVGPTICYAFMQACGMINDHLVKCFCHPDNKYTS